MLLNYPIDNHFEELILYIIEQKMCFNIYFSLKFLHLQIKEKQFLKLLILMLFFLLHYVLINKRFNFFEYLNEYYFKLLYHFQKHLNNFIYKFLKCLLFLHLYFRFFLVIFKLHFIFIILRCFFFKNACFNFCIKLTFF